MGMGVPIHDFIITSVERPKLGEIKPSKVKAEIMVDLSSFKDITLQEWNNLHENDILFLAKIKGKNNWEKANIDIKKTKKWGIGNKTWSDLTKKELGICRIRGAEIVQLK